nr:LuxR C-terminal-related transcriptional regulator [Polyangiales bacterium]
MTDHELSMFVERAIVSTDGRETLANRAARKLAAAVQLTPREAELVELAICGVRRRDLPSAIGIAESTLKWHVRSLLRKCDATNLAEVVRLALARVSERGEGPLAV